MTKISRVNPMSMPANKLENTVYYDFMALVFLSLYLFIDFLPDFKSIEIINTQFFYLAIVNAIVLLYLFKNKKIEFQKVKLFSKEGLVLKIYFLFISFCGFSLLITKNLSLSIISFMQLLIVVVMIINLILLFRDKLHLLFKVCLLVGASVFLQTTLQFNSVLQDFDNITNELNNLKGNTANINIFAASLNVKIPFLVIGILYLQDWKKWFLVLSLFLSSLTVILISSRSAYLGLFFQIIVFLVFNFKIHSLSKKAFVQTIYILVPITLSILTSTIIFKNSNDKGRFESVSNRIVQITNTNEASAAARLSYWNNASQMISKDPLTGFGIGNWKVESIPYEKTTIDEALISSHAHNDLLEIAAETGILNGLIYLSLFVVIFSINVRNTITKNDANKTLSLLVLMLVTGYFIDAFFNFPLYRPTMQLSFAFIIVFTILNSNHQISINPKSQKIGLFLITVSILAACITFSDWKAAQLEYKIKDDKTPVSSAKILSEFPLITNIGIYGETFYQHAAVAFFNENNLEEAEKYFKLSNTINSYMGVSNWYLHKIEKLKGNKEQAYKYVKTAFYSRPRTTNFYLDALKMASLKKDTTEIFKIHKLFSQYRSMPSNWKNTAVALKKADYNPAKIDAFILEGLKIFPNDSILNLKRNQKINPLTIQNSSNKPIDSDPTTTNYMVEAKKMGDVKQFEKAIALYKKELSIHPEKKVIYQDIAVCYFSLNRYENAISNLLKIINEPGLNDGKTEYMLSGCYYKMQDKTNSCKFLAIAIHKNFPGSKELFNQICQ